ncbi:YbgA family protein, partial [Bacteriovorax sp. DB6_IX]|uniref:YbgA family protein n=1 Tax=Bacteriovorax sp. DB6_IX TaxID=1353530 RepID=UPI00038A543A
MELFFSQNHLVVVVERVKHRNQETGIPDKFEAGVFGQFFIDNFPHTPIFDSGRLHDEQQRHIFLNKLFAYFRFRQNVKTVGDLQAFHKEYKYLLMGYNQNTMREMGRIAANGGDFNIYLEKLMTLLSSRISKKNIINSLYHMMGYLKKDLDLSDKEHIHSLIEDYSKQNSYENKVEPILNFLIEKYDIAYLKEQRFFNPYPK